MARRQTNPLIISPLPDGRWTLRGMVFGKRIRIISRDLGTLEGKRIELTSQIDEAAKTRVSVRLTRLTDEQLRDAEAAFEIAKGRSLVACVRAADKVLPSTERKDVKAALAEWLNALKARERKAKTISKNRTRIESLIEYSKAQWLDDITPAAVEAWVYRENLASYTRLTDASVAQAWLKWCCAKARRWLPSTPFEIDMADLQAVAKPIEKPRILTPQQCQTLLATAAKYEGGKMLPFTILSTWCFMRAAEVCRTTGELIRLDSDEPFITVNPVKRGTPSYRTVNVPENMVKILKHCAAKGLIRKALPVFFSRDMWLSVRESAGLVEVKHVAGGKSRRITGGVWQENILRHTGISYLYQKTGDIKEVCRQAGNSSETAFAHYMDLPEKGAAERFYKITDGLIDRSG